MSTDLNIIKQLEQKIGKKLEKLKSVGWNSVGYVLNESNQVIKLSLYKCSLKNYLLK